jgi:hypothetical protein
MYASVAGYHDDVEDIYVRCNQHQNSTKPRYSNVLVDQPAHYAIERRALSEEGFVLAQTPP